MKGYIYKYTFPDGKVYIGQTVRPIAARHREHTTPSTGKVNVGFWEAWEKYGDAKLEVIETVEGRESFELNAKLNSLERQYIAQYNSTNPQKGYNRVPGGFGTSASKKVLMKVFNKVFDELWEERACFYACLEDKVRESLSRPVNLDKEESAFIREVVIPEVFSEYRPYIKLSSDGKLTIKGGKGSHTDFYEEESFSWLVFTLEEIAEKESSELARDVEFYVLSNATVFLSESIIQKVDKDGTVVKEYASITEIMHDLNLSYNTNIYNVLEGKQKTAYGFMWRWKNKKPTKE